MGKLGVAVGYSPGAVGNSPDRRKRDEREREATEVASGGEVAGGVGRDAGRG